MYYNGRLGQYDVTVTAPPPEEVPYMYSEIPTELEPYKGGILEEKPISWLWLLLPVAALVLWPKRRG